MLIFKIIAGYYASGLYSYLDEKERGMESAGSVLKIVLRGIMPNLPYFVIFKEGQ